MKVAEPFHLHGQMSDSFRAAVFIILSGGFQDAYTYFCRGEVFANAQTGNIVFLSTALFQKDWPNVVKYLIPVVSFLIGTAAAELIHIRFKTYEKIHWRQIILFCEIVFLLVVGFLPAYFEPLANATSILADVLRCMYHHRQHTCVKENTHNDFKNYRFHLIPSSFGAQNLETPLFIYAFQHKICAKSS